MATVLKEQTTENALSDTFPDFMDELLAVNKDTRATIAFDAICAGVWRKIFSAIKNRTAGGGKIL